MRKIYADNGATSFPKAPGVSDAIKDFLDNAGCNINRGGYESSYNVALNVLNTRKALCKIFNFDEPRNVVFTPGITYSLNMVLRGFLKNGDHVVTTSMEHNALMRPLHNLTKTGVKYDVADCAVDGSLDPKRVAQLINPNTKAVIMTHASNVSGTVLPIYDVAEICKKHAIKLVIDSAQTAGVLQLDMEYIDALTFTCHKGLLAPQGLGGFVVKKDFAEQIEPVIIGATGSMSNEITQPSMMPDKLESGTMNIPAIIGLKKSLEYINSVGIETIHEKEMKLTERFIAGVNDIQGVNVIGKKGVSDRTAVISLDFAGRDNAEITDMLDSDYGIMARCGLHCAPSAHKTLQTYPHGTVRFSFGYFNLSDEIDYIVQSIKDVIKRGE